MATIQAGQSAVSIGEYRITTNQSTKDGPFIVQDLHRSDGPLMALRVGTTDVAQSPEAGLRATADGTTIILEDMGVDGQPVILEHERTVRCLALSPDGQLLVSGHGGTLTFWDLRSSVPAGQPVLAHDGEIFSIAFSPDGNRLASGSGDGAIRLWDVPSREPIGDPLRKHNNSAVFNLSFSPDGNRLLSSGCAEWYVHLQCLAGEVFVWDLDVASWQERACRIANRNLTQTEWTRYFDAEAYRSTCPALPPGE
jgi:WD40 repeat protein